MWPSFGYFSTFLQAMSCEGACAHAHVRCAVARVRVRAKSILESVRDVRACGPFLGVRCAITLFTLFGTNLPENATFCLKKMFLEHLFLLWNVLFCFGSSYSVFEHPKP